MLEVNYPMENGIVRNWDDMLHVWDYTFSEKLKINPKECKVGSCECVTRVHPPAVMITGSLDGASYEPEKEQGEND
jgi:hypothetical protein